MFSFEDCIIWLDRSLCKQCRPWSDHPGALGSGFLLFTKDEKSMSQKEMIKLICKEYTWWTGRLLKRKENTFFQWIWKHHWEWSIMLIKSKCSIFQQFYNKFVNGQMHSLCRNCQSTVTVVYSHLLQRHQKAYLPQNRADFTMP